MKSLPKILLAAVVAAAMCSTINPARAQQSIATWYVSASLANGGGAPPAPLANNTANPNVIVTPLMKGPGIGAITTSGAYGGNTWTNAGIADSESNSIANGLYITYAIQAAPGYTISFATNVFNFHNSATGPHSGELQYSTDGINYTDILAISYGAQGTAFSTVQTNSLSNLQMLQNVPSTTTNFFRLVNWSATGVSGTWYFNDNTPAGTLLGTNSFAVLGSVIPVPPAENLATWYVSPSLANGGGAPPALFTNNTADPNVIVSPMMKGPGIGAITTSGAYGGNAWTNTGIADSESNSIANGLYITYAIQAAPGYLISFYSNAFNFHNSATGPHSGELQYSTDGINYTDILAISYGAQGTAFSTVQTNSLANLQMLQNVPSTTTNFFRLVNWSATGVSGTWYLNDNTPAGTVLGTNSFAIIGGLFNPAGIIAPTNLVVSPSSLIANAGQTVSFSASANGSPASNFWYQLEGSTPVLIPWATSSTLTLTNVLGTNSGSYFVVLTNSSGSATSSVVTLTVINDPGIAIEPSSAQGLVQGTVQFTVLAEGTQPISYQWYFSDPSGNLIAPAATFGDGSVISGVTSNTLTMSNLQPTDLTNFVVVVTNVYGSVTSSVASLLGGSSLSGSLNTSTNLLYTSGVLALWDFDGPQFTNFVVNPTCVYNPAPFVGAGTAGPVGTTFNPPPAIGPATIGSSSFSPFSGAVDGNDVGNPNGQGFVFTPYGFEQPSPDFSWGTENYLPTSSNKVNGVQFNVSTVGAKNIRINYDSRVSATASDYERLQYTTNGTTWIDYPASSTFSGLAAGIFYPFSYSLVGFPGVDNNPNFGVRIVTEWQSTATYGISQSNAYVGTANTYGAGGTVTYDLVSFVGDAITNNNVPPTLGAFAGMLSTNGLYYTNMVDTNTLVLNFSASSPQMPASDLTFNIQSLNTVAAGVFNPTVQPTFVVNNIGSTNFTLSISFPGSFIPDPVDAAPILLTVTDTNGESTASWFLLTVSSINQPPTNSLVGLTATNTLANKALTVPFVVGSARDPYASLTYSVASDNNQVIPAANIVIGGNTNTGNLTLTVTPATNQVGNAVISVTVNDNDSSEPRSTTAHIAVSVRPNTNVVALDYFNYDNSGALDSIAAGYWQHLSGIVGQMQAGNGVGTVSDLNTENLQTALLAGPYKTNTGAVLYSSFTVNVSAAGLPTGNGSYFTAFNDGSGNTADVEDCLVAATNGAAPGFYRLGIANIVGATSADAQMVPVDLSPGVNYFVVTALSVSNGFSTLWISPSNQASPSVTDFTLPATPTNLYNISQFELRESGATEGIINVGNVLVGRTFNSVFYPPQANLDTIGVPENSTGNLLNPLANDAGSGLTLASVTPDVNGTAVISGTNISFTPVVNFTGTANISYSIIDDVGNLSSSTLEVVVTNVPPLANSDTYNVPENSTGNVFSPLTNDVIETSGGTLSLTGVSETDGNGTASANGNSVLFTPTTGFVGTAIINYSVADGLGGVSSSTITVNVGSLTPIPVNAEASGHSLIMTWANPAFGLQFATNILGPYTNIPGATSPYTNTIGTNAAGFFRLVH